MIATPTLAAENTADLLARLGQRSIVFVGLMGAGKTAIGRKVAGMLGLPFTDSDHEIESVSRMTIPDLFERYGEAEFRSLEQRLLLVKHAGDQRIQTFSIPPNNFKNSPNALVFVVLKKNVIENHCSRRNGRQRSLEVMNDE